MEAMIFLCSVSFASSSSNPSKVERVEGSFGFQWNLFIHLVFFLGIYFCAHVDLSLEMRFALPSNMNSRSIKPVPSV